MISMKGNMVFIILDILGDIYDKTRGTKTRDYVKE